MTEDTDYEDGPIYECSSCNKVLNGLSLYIVCDEKPYFLCEECYAKKEPSNEEEEEIDD